MSGFLFSIFFNCFTLKFFRLLARDIPRIFAFFILDFHKSFYFFFIFSTFGTRHLENETFVTWFSQRIEYYQLRNVTCSVAKHLPTRQMQETRQPLWRLINNQNNSKSLRVSSPPPMQSVLLTQHLVSCMHILHLICFCHTYFTLLPAFFSYLQMKTKTDSELNSLCFACAIRLLHQITYLSSFVITSQCCNDVCFDIFSNSFVFIIVTVVQCGIFILLLHFMDQA